MTPNIITNMKQFFEIKVSKKENVYLLIITNVYQKRKVY